ncbi:hypothetical protein PUNSTDRAFT_143536 [Punctularia strigosozonata HHB-11173 SS5]|uniref:uncharacterized protein n=1 Tax=Punctularia strigosozonata (strain HHB-11173) TaxID=741275 RepID=UPI000441837C|nr:uncharacterized protein PUNSTDRAFT_143536 [Punctularia strigosozonata HHB-11173 SS5]EIN08831.1 hypothetical protein PUNSTDRAFT_143536 [Punctularia strigosozonata HHB-11173 SS5]
MNCATDSTTSTGNRRMDRTTEERGGECGGTGEPVFSPEESAHICEAMLRKLGERMAELRERVGQSGSDGRDHIPVADGQELACDLLECHAISENPDAVEEAIKLFRDLLASCPFDAPSYVAILDGLGEALRARYELSTNKHDILEAIFLHNRSLKSRRQSNLNLAPSLHGLGVALYTRSIARRHSEVTDSRNAVDALLEASELRPPEDPLRPRTLAYLSLSKVKAAATTQECFPALEAAREAVALSPQGHKDHALSLIAQAWALAMTYVISDPASRPETLRSVHYTCDLALKIRHPYQSHCLRSLSFILRKRAEHARSPCILKEILMISRQAFIICPSSHIFFPSSATGLTAALSEAFSQTGDPELLDEQIKVGRDVVQACNAEANANRPLLHNLSEALLSRYRLTERTEDLAEALKLAETCVPSSGAVRPGEIPYMELAASVRLLNFRRHGEVEDIDHAIDYYRRCIPVIGEKDWTYTLGMVKIAVEALQARYVRTFNVGDLHEALALGRGELARIPTQHIRRGELLNVLSATLRLLAEHFCEPSHAEKALELHREALELVPITHSTRSALVAGLASDYACLWQLRRRAEDLHLAMSRFADVVGESSTPPHIRLRYALEWCSSSTDADPDVRSKAFGRALSLLPRIVLFGANLKWRLDALRQCPGLARDAAKHAIFRNQPRTAIELLEQGRAVFWSRALTSRQQMEGLPNALVEQLTDISSKIDVDHTEDDSMMSRRRQLTSEFDRLVGEARKTPGFEHFLRALPMSRLQEATRAGPIVVLVADERSAHALIIRHASEDVQALPLPGADLAALERVSTSLHTCNEHARSWSLPGDDGGETRKLRKFRIQRYPPLYTHEEVLSVLWTLIVHPVVEALGLKPGDLAARPRVWWCLTGPTAFLPVHAAGLYHQANPECASDYLISSYTPTITALLSAQRNPPSIRPDGPDMSVLLVAEPSAPGHAPLPNTIEEIDRLVSILPTAEVLRPEVGEATFQKVVEMLPSTSILHLACHGRQDEDDPLSSGFMLKDGMLRLSKLMELKVPNASLAFLSACESAMGDKKLPDETMHLAAVMMFIGFRSVVGTLWSMNDADGPKIAEHVYRELIASPSNHLDYEAIPRALDAAVRNLRAEGAHPSRWATWIHMGI